MSKGENTRHRIVERSAGLFNRYGYGSTPVSAVLEATGLQKGGLYNHFDSKETLAIEAFRFNLAAMSTFLNRAMQKSDDPIEQLRFLMAASLGVADGAALQGGCPVLNAAVEAADALPLLRREAFLGAEKLRAKIAELLRLAEVAGKLRKETNLESLSFFFLATLEGGIMLARLHGVSRPLEAALEVLNSVVDGLVDPS